MNKGRPVNIVKNSADSVPVKTMLSDGSVLVAKSVITDSPTANVCHFFCLTFFNCKIEVSFFSSIL